MTVARPPQLLPGRPDAIVDLRTHAGAALVGAEWRYADATIDAVDFVAVGEDLGPSGPPTRTYDVAPHAEAPDFDDSGWRRLAPPELELRLGAGLLSANWYRTSVTIPDRLGDLDPTGATIVFEVVIDDYAEVWVNGELPKALGDTGGNVASGFNAPNRVVLTRDARPGQRFDLAVFGVNGPISASPHNYIWVRSATLDVYAPERARVGEPAALEIRRLDDAARRRRPAGDRPRAHRHRLRVHRRPGVDRRGAAVQRPQHEHHLPLVAGGPGHGVPPEERLHRRRHRPLPPARLQRPRRRPRRAARDLPARRAPRRARQPARRPHRARRRATRAGG